MVYCGSNEHLGCFQFFVITGQNLSFFLIVSIAAKISL